MSINCRKRIPSFLSQKALFCPIAFAIPVLRRGFNTVDLTLQMRLLGQGGEGVCRICG